MAFVYILRCGDGSLYTGSAKDLTARLRQHLAGRASRYTRSRLPVTLLWSCELATWGEALREEHRIKRLPRRLKEALAAGPGRVVGGLGAKPRSGGKPPVRRAGLGPDRVARNSLGAKPRRGGKPPVRRAGIHSRRS